ncbi:hypothetical protein GUY44_06910 [Pimelobacter simplex]|uniref:Uncharacterized protein n=1 Tax=Nocardioides simplex TaxID=2045 RepID=A0A0A1DM77_NOCSI|nr:hypothetical protein [Pimelobacter simplex]AIY17742.1 hypothetical protein KR76_15005 [Pimelobacter simplex]MCG8150201.1 hypothetical protein [Pimelobacter simplex]GEB13589.1 hypothetical protein NSI01_19040 [Pimelobacter simplex]SFM71326.1 hypothetical protein SAMN05421671_3083 [Pimelobacter simplex]
MSGKGGVLAMVGGAVVAIGVTIGAAVALTGGTDLKDVAATCEISEAPEVVTVGDGGDSLTVGDGQAEVANKASTCVLDELDAPDSVRGKVLDTNAAQGRQSDSWDDWEVSWTYHPDRGLHLIVEKA